MSGTQQSSTRASPSSSGSKFAPYKQALKALSERTRTPLPSLVFSFAILHELTAIIPLGGFFFAARAFNVGDRITRNFPARTSEGAAAPDAKNSSVANAPTSGWMAAKSREWWQEGQTWAERVGRRYGFFGLEKRNGRDSNSSESIWSSEQVAGDVVNAVVAYCLTKALLPARIGLSLYLSPAFSRGVIEPMRLTTLRAFSRKPRSPPV
ncbi:uncharacterized protein FIBRA_05097 [Fibroporia radiculosa]|uniref:Uncharacterized protein n=1 Tax=Fibroporia radiculosa TaxID=599839 RepID=J4HWY4_9APHY|nr:uncharacterized protein FIBRA_05097 [Fibroporia radiculosa]CCM02982.1 predicted protein [Fibroporia radiculosa]